MLHVADKQHLRVQRGGISMEARLVRASSDSMMKIADSPEPRSRRDPESLFATEISVTLDKKRVR